MDPDENPYRPGAGTQPPALLGRDELIANFATTVRRAIRRRPGKSVMPIGLRGVGKTVLLNRFAQIGRDEGLRIAFIEAPETGEFASQLTGRLRRTLLALDAEKASKKVLRALSILKTFSLQLPDGATFSLDVDAVAGLADSGNLSDDLSDLLVAVGEATAERSTGLVIVVDEVQYLTQVELAALITAVHRTTQMDLPVILVGAGLPQLPARLGDAKSYAERLFDFPLISSLDPLDAAAAITIPAQEQRIVFAPEAVARIVAAAHGYPYFLQEWGYHTWNAARTSPIEADVVETVTSEVLDQLDRNFFFLRFDRLTPAEKKYLRAMAELGPDPHRSGDIAAALGVKVESVAPRRSSLIGKGMIYSPSHGDTAFTVPLFDEFLRRSMP
jgi:hypothetical protein